ncbi:MAG: ribosome assembly RNA-binding protein YhbY [Eubacterium sp.]|jgi:RNA-binding protein|nr:ribosome assembly RNA-binding protein YhbY [Eubacterium sp.]NBI85673.1 ribosome assembly RNA-binding protein YhbY [Lachnospiraceae bacterium]
MLNSKQRAYLMSMASKQQAIFQVGKASLTPEIISSVDAALEKRELVKISVLKNCFDDPKEIAQMMAERTRSQVVQVIGKKIILFRVSKKKPVIELPK